MKKFTIIITILISVLSGYSQTYNPHVDTIIQETNLDSLVYFVRNLSGEDSVVVNGELSLIDHRVSNWGNDLAADYILETFTKFGLESWIQEYSAGGKNVLAMQEGTLFPEEYYIICAHYDAVDYYCADDNASGSAGVMEAARIFSEYEFEYSILYALWDEEELGLIGSGYYANQAAANGDQILGVVNMDMIAWDSDEDMVVEIHSSYSGNSNLLSDYINNFVDVYNLQVVPSVQLPGASASDHSRFWNQGYQAVLLIEEYYGGDFNPYYHTANDRISIFNLPYFHEMAKLAIGVIAAKANPVIETGVHDIYDRNVLIDIQVFPNPFLSNSMIKYTLGSDSQVEIKLLNSIGNAVIHVTEQYQVAGEYEVKLRGHDLPAGLYLLWIRTETGSVTRHLIKKE